jgi:acetyl-CoA carboxylase biotin carboxyl carrier protein
MAERGHEIVAEMVANVLTVAVGPGDQVAVGDTVCLLESMKMEIPVVAEVAGTICDVAVSAGDVVQSGDLIAVVDPAGDDAA